jgi:DNA-binding response OmpR family regulator
MTSARGFFVMIMDPRPTAFLVSYGRGADALAAALEAAGLDVKTHPAFQTAAQEADSVQPDLILFSDSPDATHIRFLSELRDQRYAGLLLFLTESIDSTRVSQVLEAGAHDVIGPPHSVGAILLRRLVHLKRRAPGALSYARSKQLTLGDVTVDPATHEVMGGSDRSCTLSGRELEVLVRLMEARGDVVPREELLAGVWGEEHCSEAVLDTTVHRLRRKLEEQISRPNLVSTVRGVGYRLRTG